ncbi:ShlB/FhaC/HecB family hemolysin secretion/activation protein [Sandaracinobacter sp. RS1-74]|nr:ShlB/FhaC/HecB family hemolysin secretion/activation protein [Sandaracinobacteroides sayramensis]
MVERAIYPFMGPGRTESDVEGARSALQKAFEDAGYVAVSVFIPEQSVESGILLLEVQPQTVANLVVEGSSRPDSVKALAPSVAPGVTPNLPAFQRDVVALNSKAHRTVTPELRAGEAPGTLDVILKVEERSPFHASVELNNFSSAATSDLRLSGTLRYDNMWGRGDSLSLSAQTAPRRTDDGTVFSGNYLMRLGQGTQLLAYGVYSDSDIAVVGGTSVIGKGKMGGLRLIQSLGSGDGFYHSLTAGIDYKDFKEDVLLGADRATAPITYFPATVSWRGDWAGAHSSSTVTFSTVFGIRAFGDDWEAFDAKRYQARPSFLVWKLDAETTQTAMGDIQLNARLSGQWSASPLISNEGFSLGGMSSVRGYYESEALGDYGFALQTELRSPELGGLLGDNLPNALRLHLFTDIGYAGIHDALPGQESNNFLLSGGAGGRIRLFNYFNAAVDAGVPLLTGPSSGFGDIFVRFRIQGEF